MMIAADDGQTKVVHLVYFYRCSNWPCVFVVAVAFEAIVAVVVVVDAAAVVAVAAVVAAVVVVVVAAADDVVAVVMQKQLIY